MKVLIYILPLNDPSPEDIVEIIKGSLEENRIVNTKINTVQESYDAIKKELSKGVQRVVIVANVGIEANHIAHSIRHLVNEIHYLKFKKDSYEIINTS